MRYLLPWIEDNGFWFRPDLTTGECDYGETIHQDPLDGYWYHDLGGMDKYHTIEEAQNVVDEYLVDLGDCVLIPEEEVDNYGV